MYNPDIADRLRYLGEEVWGREANVKWGKWVRVLECGQSNKRGEEYKRRIFTE